MTDPSGPIPASTVVLLRDAGVLEVFLVRRHEQLAFMGGAHVFPGGRVDDSDRGPDDPDGHRIAALRELFEEGGVLLAADANGDPLSFADSARRERFREHRRAVLEHHRSFREILNREHVTPDFDRLALLAEWVTPPHMPRRFDTRFFAARAPGDQDALHDDGETTESLWIAPADALARAGAGAIDLPVPTRHTLEELAQFSRVKLALAWCRARLPPRFEPQ